MASGYLIIRITIKMKPAQISYLLDSFLLLSFNITARSSRSTSKCVTNLMYSRCYKDNNIRKMIIGSSLTASPIILIGTFIFALFILSVSAQTDSGPETVDRAGSDSSDNSVDVTINGFDVITMSLRADGQPSSHDLPRDEIGLASVQSIDPSRQATCFFVYEYGSQASWGAPQYTSISASFTTDLGLSQPFQRATHVYCYDSTADSAADALDDLFIVFMKNAQGIARLARIRLGVTVGEADEYEADLADDAEMGSLDLSTMGDPDLGPATVRATIIRLPSTPERYFEDVPDSFALEFVPAAFCVSKLMSGRRLPFYLDDSIAFLKPRSVTRLVCYKTDNSQAALKVWLANAPEHDGNGPFG